MNTAFANWTPNTTPFSNYNTGNPGWNQNWNQGWNPNWQQNSFYGFTPNQPSLFGQTPSPTPQQFWNQNGPWNQTCWNQNAPYTNQPFNGYGYGPNGWWFGNNTQYNTPFGNQFSGNGFNQPWNTTVPQFNSFNGGFTPGYNNSWDSATTPWLNSTPAFQPMTNSATPYAFTPQFTGFNNPGFNNWQPFGTWLNTANTTNAQSISPTAFNGFGGSPFVGAPLGNTPWNATGFGGNTPSNFIPTGYANTTQQHFGQAPFGHASGFAQTGYNSSNFAPNNGNWNQPTPSYTGTPENYANAGTPNSYTQTPVNCNGRDAA
jgi:hypothetical protein